MLILDVFFFFLHSHLKESCAGLHVDYESLHKLQYALMYQVEQNLAGVFYVCVSMGFARIVTTISTLIMPTYDQE